MPLGNINKVFVFGSNLAGIHGAGAAKVAHYQYGAVWGKGVGMHGRSYAIPTKGYRIEKIGLHRIRAYVDDFIKHAKQYPDETFIVTALGTGLAGHSHRDMAVMFVDAPKNCFFDSVWAEHLPYHESWGTY